MRYRKGAKESFEPIILRFILSTLLYIVLPGAGMLSGVVKISVDNSYGSVGIILIVVGIVLYFSYIATRFIPGIYAIFDLITDNFISEKMVYVNTFTSDSGLYTRTQNRKTALSNMNQVSIGYLLRITLADNKGKTFFTTVYLHSMEPGKAYSVTYGKFSRILISATDSSGVEMLRYD